jgi:hypothetical protein
MLLWCSDVKEALMSKKTCSLVERILIALILLGIVGMFQPIVIDLYRYGFLLLLFSTLGFIVFSHMSPKNEEPDAVRTE